MEDTIIHKSNSRGHANHGWLNANHSFSFASYYNPERMNFGVLRVLNDDTIAPGMGFGMHPHENMEIITIPLEGDLEHKDSMGNTGIIKYGDVQVMSAGTGIFHSEVNKNKDRELKLLQIWVLPNKSGVTPRYDQLTLNLADRHNKLQQVLSPNENDEGVWIHQNAWFHLGKFDENFATEYTLKNANNGVYIFLIEGKAAINGNELDRRDAIGITNSNTIKLQALSNNTEILIMEIPMEI
jgi:redox-sensitive bicupin YhaK (pirin superfamily)